MQLEGDKLRVTPVALGVPVPLGVTVAVTQDDEAPLLVEDPETVPDTEEESDEDDERVPEELIEEIPLDE